MRPVLPVPPPRLGLPRRTCWPAAALAVLAGGTALAAPGAGHARAPDSSPEASRVWGDSGALSSAARAEVERATAAAARRAAVPVFVAVFEHARENSAAAFAARTFDERGLAALTARNVVLLAVVLRPPHAAIETGKGNAGIIPELDARRITGRLASRLSARHPEEAIAEALAAVAASAQATAARRTPLPRDALDPDLGSTGSGDDGPGAEQDPQAPPPDGAASPVVVDRDAGTASPGDAGVPPGASTDPQQSSRPSRRPIAAAIGVLVLLGLALRRRRQLAAERRGKDPDPPRRF